MRSIRSSPRRSPRLGLRSVTGARASRLRRDSPTGHESRSVMPASGCVHPFWFWRAATAHLPRAGQQSQVTLTSSALTVDQQRFSRHARSSSVSTAPQRPSAATIGRTSASSTCRIPPLPPRRGRQRSTLHPADSSPAGKEPARSSQRMNPRLLHPSPGRKPPRSVAAQLVRRHKEQQPARVATRTARSQVFLRALFSSRPLPYPISLPPSHSSISTAQRGPTTHLRHSYDGNP